MAKKIFTDESLGTLVSEIKSYTDDAVSTKANSSHTHTISNVTNLQSSLDAKVPTSRTVNGKALTANITLSASDVGAAASSHNHDSAYDAKGSADSALASAKTYADNAANTVKNDLLNNAGSAYDTLKELGDLIDDNTDAIDALEIIASNKADKTYVDEELAKKADLSALTNYYTKSEIDNMELITVDDIDEICGATIEYVSLDEGAF